MAEFRPDLMLLASRPLFRAESHEQMEAGLRAAFDVGHMSFAHSETPFVGVSNRVDLGEVGLGYCRYDTPAKIEFLGLDGFIQIICLSGSATITASGIAITIDQDTSCIIPPNVKFVADYGDNYSHIFLRLDRGVLVRKADAILPVEQGDDIAWPMFEAVAAARFWRLKSIALTLAQQFSEDISEKNVAIARLAQALAATFVQDNLRRVPTAAPDGAGAGGSARAFPLEDYIEANWDQPLSIEDMAAASGISVRSVFNRIKARHGLSPMAYLRDVRLRQAHRLLLEGNQDTSVIDVAMRCGFASFGHFARRYRERFGELPSTTLARRPAPERA